MNEIERQEIIEKCAPTLWEMLKFHLESNTDIRIMSMNCLHNGFLYDVAYDFRKPLHPKFHISQPRMI